MISYDRSSTVSPLVLGLGALLVAGGLGAWWWSSGSGEAPPASADAASVPMVASAPAATVTPAPVAGDDDFAPENLGALNQVMSKQPEGEKELQRVTSFLKFQRGFERWQEMQDQADAGPRHELARSLMASLPDRVRSAEITLPEAALMCGMMLNDLEPNEQLREQKMAECHRGLEAVSPRVDTEQGMRAAQCQTEYRRREAALVAEFQARPATQRDAARLEADLQKARKDVFDSPTCGL